MTTQEIASRLHSYCSAGKFKEALKDLFARDAVSIEPDNTPGFDKETKGLDAMLKKSEQFDSMVDQVHGIKASQPVVAGNAIAMSLDMDVTMKGRGRTNMAEVCVYTVKDGKIVREEFFW
ncbi:MAG TPA: nuclear transport factor 2 family protein [Puia sp.]|nr:nuclear transport factor 2 family protein [Puia sp.]